MCCKNNKRKNVDAPIPLATFFPLEHLCCMAKMLYTISAAVRLRFQGFQDPDWADLTDDERLEYTQKVKDALEGELTSQSDSDPLLADLARIVSSGS